MDQEPHINIGRQRLFLFALAGVSPDERRSTVQDLVDPPTIVFVARTDRHPISGNWGGLVLGSLGIRNRSNDVSLLVSDENITFASLNPLDPTWDTVLQFW